MYTLCMAGFFMAENVHCRIVESIGKFRYLARLFGGERCIVEEILVSQPYSENL